MSISKALQQNNLARSNQPSIAILNVEILIMQLKCTQNCYDLYMRVDTNTKGHRQWYYFSVKNKKPIKVIFNLYRFNKSLSLYQRGMRPYILSKKQSQLNKVSWKQGGKNCRYILQNNLEKKKRYILTFEYEFKYENDEVYFAACPPYSYTFLNHRIQQFKSEAFNLNFEISQLGKTVVGLSIPLLTIQKKNKSLLKKKFIVIAGRTHPGQSASSWVIDGLIKYIIQRQQNCSILHNIVYKIVPMVNPDGVFVGNYRTGIVGVDFNRKFYSGQSKLFPEIQGLKKLITDIRKQGQIIGFFDIHGHSILRNSFIFGPNLQSYQNSQLILFPEKLEQISTIFKRDSCRFKNQKDKIETARVYFQYCENILSFTIENSLGLYFNKYQTIAMEIQDWRNFGRSIGQSINTVVDQKQQTKKELIVKLKKNLQIFNQEKKQEIKQSHNKYENSLQENEEKRYTALQNKNPKKIKNLQKLRESKKVKPRIFDDKRNLSTNDIPFSQYNSQVLKEKILIFEEGRQRFKFRSTFHINLSGTQNETQKIQIQDNLSENFDEDINDNDSSSEDLEQQHLIKIFQVISKDKEQQQQETNNKQVNTVQKIKSKSEIKSESRQNIGFQTLTKYIENASISKAQQRNTPPTLVTLNGFRQIKFFPKNSLQQNKNDVYFQKYQNYRKKKQKQRKQKQMILRLEKPENLNYSKHGKELLRYLQFHSMTTKQQTKDKQKFKTIHAKQYSRIQERKKDEIEIFQKSDLSKIFLSRKKI